MLIKIRNNKGLIISSLFLLFLSVFAICSCFPDVFAYAVEADEVVKETSPAFLDIGGHIDKGICNVLQGMVEGSANMANEFFKTITGNNVFTVGINDDKFSSVNYAVSIICDKLRPVGYTALGLFMGFECLSIMKDTNQNISSAFGMGGLDRWIVFAIKCTIMFSVITNAKALMLIIYTFIGYIQTGITNALTIEGLNGDSNTFQTLIDMNNNLTFGDYWNGVLTMLVIVSLVSMVVSAITAIYVQILAVTRIFEIFLLMAVSPVSLVGFVSNKTSSLTSSYIKTFCGACLQLSIILLIIALAGPLINSLSGSIGEVFKAGQTGVQALMGCITPIVTTLAVFVMVKKSRPIADKLCQA